MDMHMHMDMDMDMDTWTWTCACACTCVPALDDLVVTTRPRTRHAAKTEVGARSGESCGPLER